jgi:hypothetical protein
MRMVDRSDVLGGVQRTAGRGGAHRGDLRWLIEHVVHVHHLRPVDQGPHGPPVPGPGDRVGDAEPPFDHVGHRQAADPVAVA